MTRYRVEYVAGAGGLQSSIVRITPDGIRERVSLASDARPRPVTSGAVELGELPAKGGTWRRILGCGWALPLEEIEHRRRSA